MDKILESKCKPDLTNYSYEELFESVSKYDTKITNYENKSKAELVKIIIDLWKNRAIGIDISCPICLELVSNGDNMITDCCHYFHSSCMIKYILSSKVKKNFKKNKNITCPQCRKIFYSNESLHKDNLSDKSEDNISYVSEDGQIIINSPNNSIDTSFSVSSDDYNNSDNSDNSEYNSHEEINDYINEFMRIRAPIGFGNNF